MRNENMYFGFLFSFVNTIRYMKCIDAHVSFYNVELGILEIRFYEVGKTSSIMNKLQVEPNYVKILKETCYNTSVKIVKSVSQNICRTHFDGILCWPQTTVGQLSVQPCPNHQTLKSEVKGLVRRYCNEAGIWVGENNQPQANYSECGKIISNVPIAEIYDTWLPIIKKISFVGNTVSILSLTIAFLIFVYIKTILLTFRNKLFDFRRLHCSRNYLHMNLFGSSIMRSILTLMKDMLFLYGNSLIFVINYEDGELTMKERKFWICNLIVALWKYFIVSNYIMILMEGIYLHNLIFLTLLSERSSILIYALIGWVLPVIFTLPWIILKVTKPAANEYCWTITDKTSLLIEIPICVTVVINFLLFLIIVRILCIKLNSMYIQQRKLKYRKLLKATLILLPLFGVPYTISLILQFYVARSQILEIFWLFFDQTFSAFQGLIAALTYCLLNSDVQTELQRKYNSIKDRSSNREFRRSRTISHTLQTSLHNGEDLIETFREIKESDF